MKILNIKENLKNRALWTRGGTIAALLIAGLFAACSNPDYGARVPSDTTEVEDVVEDTDELQGQTVTVSGEVEEIVGFNAFVLEGEELIGTDESVLVINARPIGEPIKEGENIQVTGQVAQFTIAEFERDYDLNWDLEIKEKIEAEFKNKPVIVADFTQVL